MKKQVKALTITLAVLSLAFLFAINSQAKSSTNSSNSSDNDLAPNNVSIGGQDVSGMSLDEIEEVVEAYLDNYDNVEFKLVAGDKSVVAGGDDLDLTVKNDDVASRALNYGKQGNLIARYKANADTDNGKKKDFKISLTTTNATVAEYLNKKESELNTEAQNNGLKLEDGKFKYVKGTDGEIVQVNKSVIKIANFICDEWDGEDATIKLSTKKVEAIGKKEDLMKVKDKLGEYTTNYSTSGAGRCTNVANATSKINGTILYPGETFSVYKTVSPFDAEHGYALAGSYENGTVVETYGGGICQVSTTLYNAVIRSELEIVERSSHSMIVDYVKPSMDAAIAGTAKDFKFKNNTKYPIYISGYTANKNVYFTIYGVETRDSNRTVEYESEVLEQLDPETEFVYSDEFAAGTISRTQPAHVGYTARLWKIVKVSGKEESRKVYNNSKYKKTNAVYTIGSNGLSASGRASIDAAIATNDVPTVKAAVASAAGMTDAVVVTPDTTPTNPIEATPSTTTSNQ